MLPSKINWGGLVFSIFSIVLIGNIGSLATFSQITTWYAGLNKPSFNPPSWIFGPVWLILFTLMGISLYLIWQHGAHKKGVRFALSIFAFQLVLNVLWTFLFFGFHTPILALIEIVLMWLAILTTIIVFRSISKPAAWLLVPYLVWVTFAALLNFSIWQLN